MLGMANYCDPGFWATLHAFDPSITVVLNHRTHRWVVVQDLAKTNRVRWMRVDPALIGVPGLEQERTSLKVMFVLQSREGIPIKPNAEWIVRKLQESTTARQADKKTWAQVEAGFAAQQRAEEEFARAASEEEGDYAHAVKVKRNYSYAGQTNRSGRS